MVAQEIADISRKTFWISIRIARTANCPHPLTPKLPGIIQLGMRYATATPVATAATD